MVLHRARKQIQKLSPYFRKEIIMPRQPQEKRKSMSQRGLMHGDEERRLENKRAPVAQAERRPAPTSNPTQVQVFPKPWSVCSNTFPLMKCGFLLLSA